MGKLRHTHTHRHIQTRDRYGDKLKVCIYQIYTRRPCFHTPSDSEVPSPSLWRVSFAHISHIQTHTDHVLHSELRAVTKVNLSLGVA